MAPPAPRQWPVAPFVDEAGPRLTHDEPVASGVERPARTGRVVVPPGEGTHGTKAGDADLVDRRLGPPAEHHVGTAEPDVVEALSDRHVRRGAGRALRRERTTRPELHRDPARTHVRDDAGNREGIDTVGAALLQRVVAV